MTGFVSAGFYNGTGLLSTASSLQSQKATNTIIEERVSLGCAVGKVILSAFALSSLLNIGSMTGASPVEIKPIKITHNHFVEAEVKKDPSFVEKSNVLQKGFNFNVSQWASLLKVERKTIYNWNSKKETRIKNATMARINAFEAFYRELEPSHLPYLKKFIFGKMTDESIKTAFYEEPLSFDNMINAYYDLYAQIEGYSVRAKLA